MATLISTWSAALIRRQQCATSIEQVIAIGGVLAFGIDKVQRHRPVDQAGLHARWACEFVLGRALGSGRQNRQLDLPRFRGEVRAWDQSI
jgi:hypothetical protein